MTDQTITTDPQPTEQSTLMFFAYGTLRKGQALHNWIADEVVNEKGAGTMKFARLFYGSSHKAYPYLVFTGAPADEAVGELYELQASNQVMRMLQMEMNAGYKIFEAEVMVNGEPTMAMVCAWTDDVGGQVPNNDWCSVQNEGW
jgi:gamma-glutamylcyclotransferase (GGCT)/AIG2-like uncharacterized protein YtfP